MDGEENAVLSELLNVGSGVAEKPDFDNMSDEQLQAFYQQLLAQNQVQAEASDGAGVEKAWDTVKPTPGMCVKTRKKGADGKPTAEKVFLNICTSSTVPMPRHISEQELIELLEKYGDDSDEVVDYRVPMSIGDGHAEVDNRGAGCVAYDIIVNPAYLRTIRDSKLFFGFFMSIVLEGIDNKYGVQLDRDWSLLKNRKFVGCVEQQNLRKKALIQDITSAQHASETKTKEPKYKLLREPESGHPEYLIAQVWLTGVDQARQVMVDVGEDRLVVVTRPNKFLLDVYLPFNLVQEECGSQFDTGSKLLTVTMPVQPLTEESC